MARICGYARWRSFEYQNLFEIWKKDQQIDYEKYLSKFRNIKFLELEESSSTISLRKAQNLNLKLKLITSFDLYQINNNWWGTKAIFTIK